LLQKISARTELPAQGLWLGVRIERQAADREAENSYATQLKRRFPDDLRTQWLITGQYEQGGSLL
jgi:type IV pilus assembly protein PilF